MRLILENEYVIAAMSNIIILYSTTDGHTRDICQCLQRVVEEQAQHVSLVPIHDAAGIDLAAFDKIVIGASIRYGKHQPEVYAFIKKNLSILQSRLSAFFTVNVVARKPEKSTPETNPYLIKFLKQIAWKPDHLAVFAGKIDYKKYKVIDRIMIRFIMWMTKGPTDPSSNIDFTNWNQVKEFGLFISNMQRSKN